MPAVDLETPYAVDQRTIHQFRSDGFVRLPRVLSEHTLAYYRPEINRLGRVSQTPLARRR